MKYRRLPGKKRSFGHWRTLWMGEDHLLAVDSNGYSEDYVRYHYKDIMAVITRRTAGMWVGNGILATALGVCLLVLFTSLGDGATPWAVTMTVFSALLLAGILVNTLRGPTCRCHILMPLGIRELPTLRRIKTVRKTLDRLRPFIGERQGTIVPDYTFARSVPPTAEPLPMSIEPLLRDVTSPPETVKQENAAAPGYRGGAHYAAFSLLIVQAFLGVTALEYHGTLFLFMYGFLMLGLFVCLVTAVVKQHSRMVPRLAGKLAWAALLSMTCAIFLGYYVGVFLNVMKTKGKANPEMVVPEIFFSITTHPYFPFCIVCFSVCSAVIGVLGLLSYLRGKARPGDAGRKSDRALPRDFAP
jgi:hypothetical protein